MSLWTKDNTIRTVKAKINWKWDTVAFIFDQANFAVGYKCIGILMEIIHYKTKKTKRSNSQSNDLGLESYLFSKGLYDYT